MKGNEFGCIKTKPDHRIMLPGYAPDEEETMQSNGSYLISKFIVK